MRNPEVKLGNQIVKVRETARELGMDPSSLSKILRGDLHPHTVRFGTLKTLATRFHFRSTDAFVDAVMARRAAKGSPPPPAHVEPERGSGASSHRGSSSCPYCDGHGREDGCPSCGRLTASSPSAASAL